MFKEGDRVVCVKQSYHNFYVPLHNVYTILSVDVGHGGIRIENDARKTYSPDRFILLSEYRKQKLKKICSNQGIK